MGYYDAVLGFPGAALAILLFVPALALVVRRKWRIAEERKAEVRRLLRLAAEEEARAQIESAFVYMAETVVESAPVEVSIAGGGGGGDGGEVVVRKCAVCFSPTNTRCSRCKAVRYCSGKCQIIHWRQGHKDECRPFVDNKQCDASGAQSVSKILSTEKFALPEDVVDNLGNKSSERHLEENDSSGLGGSSVMSDRDDNEVGSPMVKSGSESTSDSSAASLSCSSAASCTGKDTIPISNPTNSLNADAHHDVAVKSTSSISTSHGDLSNAKLREEVVSSKIPDPSFSFIMSDDAIPSQTSVGRAKSAGGATLPNGVNVPRAKDPLPSYPETKASVFNGRANVVMPANSRDSRPPPNVVSGTDLSGEKHLLRKTVMTSAHIPSIQHSSVVNSASNGTHVMQPVHHQRIIQAPPKPAKSSKAYKMLPLYDFYIKLYNEKVELQPCGFINCGNSCYANAVLQCLAFTRPLTAFLLQRHHSNTCLKKDWCFTCEFESLLTKAKQGKSPVSPVGILSQIRKIGKNLAHGKEEDAHEFLRYAIDAMQPACLDQNLKSLTGSRPDETTLVELIFGGYLRSKIRCMGCQGTSERYERIMDLTVEINGDIATLEEALSGFTAPELLDGENMYKCSRCQSYVKAKKKLSVLEAPNVLTIVLKRFQSGEFGKLNKEVRFPDILSMSEYMSSGSLDVSPVYCLFAVIVHLDTMNASFSGHYVCYVKDTQGKWYRIDDSIVEPVEINRVLSEKAYMLLYARCSPRAPRLTKKAMPNGPRSFRSSRCRESLPFGRTRSRDVQSRHGEPLVPPYGVYEAESSSDNGSLLSYSDEGSSSTRDSTSTDEMWDSFFGESVYSYSPLSSRVSSDASSVGRSSSLDLNYDGVPGSEMQEHLENREMLPQGKESSFFLPSDTIKHRRKLTEQFRTDKSRTGLFMRRNKDLSI